MSFRKDILDTANDIRRDIPRSLDLRQQNKVEILRRDWVQGPRADGGYTESVTELTERYKVRQITTDEVAASGGVYEIGDVRVGPITPWNGRQGYKVEDLAPDAATGNQRNRFEVLYQLSGPHSGLYRRIALETVSDTSWFLTLRRTERQGRAGR